MKKLSILLFLLFFTVQLSAHCGGCGPKKSVTTKSALDNGSCISCEDKKVSSTKLNLTKKEQKLCDDILSEYQLELARLKTKYTEKFDEVLSSDDLELYLKEHQLTKI